MAADSEALRALSPASRSRFPVVWNALLCCGSTVGMLCAAFPPCDWGALAWIALVPWVKTLIGCNRPAVAAGYGFLTGMLWSAITFDWMRTAASGNLMVGPLGYAWAFLFLVSGLTLAISSSLLWTLHRAGGWPLVIAIPVAWMAGEELRDILVRWAAETTSELFRLAITQVHFPIVTQAADLAGSSLVSWMVAAGNGLVADMVLCRDQRVWNNPRRWLARVVIAAELVTLGVYGGWQFRSQSVAGPTVAIIPNSVDAPRIDGTAIDQPDFRADVAIFPETSSSGVWNGDAAVHDRLTRVARELGCPVLIGCKRLSTQPLGLFNSAVLISARGEVLGVQDKLFPTPCRESLPVLVSLFSQPTIDLPGICFPGTEQCPLTLPNGTRVGVGICHDICFPEWSRNAMVQFQPDLLVVIANETFDTSGRVQPLLLACARMRAIECRRPLIRCVSGGISAVIDANGQLIVGSKRSAWTDPFVCQAIPLDLRNSPFTDWGRSGLWLLMLLPVISVFRPVSGVE